MRLPTYRIVFLLVDSDVALREGSAGRITVVKADRNGVRSPGRATVSYTHAERDSGSVVQMTPGR